MTVRISLTKPFSIRNSFQSYLRVNLPILYKLVLKTHCSLDIGTRNLFMAAVDDSIQAPNKEVRFEGDENTYRGNWSNKMDFILSCVGYAVGLGNLWRFPYLCYKNGGGAFLIPYFIMLIVAGIPLFYFELSLGQFSSSGFLTMWKVQPMFKGIGFAMLIISIICSIYYNVIIAWSLYYLFASFTSKLPWSDCNNVWNDELCLTDFKNVTSVVCSSDITTNCTKYEVAAEQYWQRVVLGVVNYAGEQRPMEPYLGTIQWHLSLCLLLAWIICGASLIKGVKSSGKVVYFTAIFPYAVIFIMIINGSLLEGSLEGIKYYLIPKWSKLLEAKVWGDAATQIFYSLSVGFGGLMTMASYNKFNNNCYRDALMVSVINCATSFVAGFAIFSVLGYMSVKTGRSVAETTTSGTGLAFVVYAQGVATMPYAPIWSILFFAMLLTLGIDSQFGGMEAIFTGLQDQFPILKKTHFHDFSFKIIFQIIMFFLGLPCVAKGGIYMVTLMDEYCGSFSLIIIAFLELTVISYLYGVKNFIQDIEMMLKFKPGYYWIICWTALTPIVIIFILIVCIIQHSPSSYNGVQLPKWANQLGGVIAASSVSAVPIYFFYYAIFNGFSFKPDEEWGPGVEKFWHDDIRYSKKLKLKNSANLTEDIQLK